MYKIFLKINSQVHAKTHLIPNLFEQFRDQTDVKLRNNNLIKNI